MMVFLAMPAAPGTASPYRPTNDDVVLATIPAAAAAAGDELRRRRRALAERPAEAAAAISFARLAIQDGRSSADPRRFGEAEAALRPWWQAADAPLEIRVLRAVIRESLHDFRGAASELDAILAADPRDAQARLTRAFLRQTVGDMAGAADDCRSLPASVGLTVRAICAARVAALTGAAEPALERITAVSLVDGKAAPQTQRWAHAVAAEIALMLGRNVDAERHFKLALADGGDVPTLVAYADFLLDSKRPRDALALLADHGEADIVLLRLAIAADRVADGRGAAWTSLLAERFAAARASGNQLHLREEARFELEVRNNPDRALDLARANWAIQKELADARLLLEAADGAGNRAAAADVLRFLADNSIKDVRLQRLQDEAVGGRP